MMIESTKSNHNHIDHSIHTHIEREREREREREMPVGMTLLHNMFYIFLVCIVILLALH